MVNYSKNNVQVCLSVLFCTIVSFMSIILGLFMDLQHPFTHGELSVVFGAFVSRTKGIKNYFFFVMEYFMNFETLFIFGLEEDVFKHGGIKFHFTSSAG